MEEYLEKIKVQQETVACSSLASTHRSLCMLTETEIVGVETSRELAEQGERLKNASLKLDEINANLKLTQKNITRMKGTMARFKSFCRSKFKKQQPSIANNTKTIGETVDTEPEVLLTKTPRRAPTYGDPVEQQLANNLDSMTDHISTLKHIAREMGEEITTQNALVESMKVKVVENDIKMAKQTSQIKKL